MGRKISIAIFAPRTHPNLRYLTRELQESGQYSTTICVDVVTQDFCAPSGVEVMSWENLREEFREKSLRYDIAVVKSTFLESRTTEINEMARLVIQYDQARIGGSLGQRIIQLVSRIKRALWRHPSIRVSPTVGPENYASIWVTSYDGAFIHPGPSTAEIDIALKSSTTSSDLPVVVTVAKSYQNRKRTSALIKSLELLPYRVELRVIRSSPVFVGSKPSKRDVTEEQEVRNAITSSKHAIIIFENISQLETLNVMAGANLFVLISEKEPFSISNLEAISLGVPCILAETNGSLRTMPKGSYFATLKQMSISSLTEIIDTAIREPEKYFLSRENIAEEASLRNAKSGLSQLLLNLK